MLDIVGWIVAIVAGYVVLAGAVLTLFLGFVQTAGRVDWSGARKPAPVEPIEIGYRGDPQQAFGWNFDTVRYPTDLGEAEAWVIPAEEASPVWAIFVHGIGGIRENGYRMARVLREAGATIMMITYRNDPGAPRSADGLYSFGLGEWLDLEAAVDWARRHGAERLVLVGESMGAGIIGQYLARAADTSAVAGLALDAPALDYPAVIAYGGRRLRVPLHQVIVPVGLWLGSLVRVDLRRAVSLEAVARFKGPIFVGHGRHDPLVPFSISEQLVALRPDAIFVPGDTTEHPKSYWGDPEGYRAGLLKLVDAVRRSGR